MTRSLEHEIYKPKIIKCRCGRQIGETAADNQILIIGGLAFFNYAAWRCLSCSAVGSFVAPLLPSDDVNLDNTCPDVKELEKRARLGITRLAHNRFRVRVKDKYIGVFPDEQTAVKAREAANLKNFIEKNNYRRKEKQPDEHFHKNAQTA